MKIALTLLGLAAMAGCQTSSYREFSESEKNISAGRNWCSFLVEVVYPFDPPRGKVYSFDLSDNELAGFVRELGENNERPLDSTEAHRIYTAFQAFDWSSPVDDHLYDPNLITMFPDDYVVTIKSHDSFAEREIRVGFSTSLKTRNLLFTIGFMSPNTEQTTEQILRRASPAQFDRT